MKAVPWLKRIRHRFKYWMHLLLKLETLCFSLKQRQSDDITKSGHKYPGIDCKDGKITLHICEDTAIAVIDTWLNQQSKIVRRVDNKLRFRSNRKKWQSFNSVTIFFISVAFKCQIAVMLRLWENIKTKLNQFFNFRREKYSLVSPERG